MSTKNDNRLKTGLASAAVLAVGTTMTFLAAPALATDDGGSAGQVCAELDSGKVDTNGDPQTVTITAPAGFLIDSYCVKAGSAQQGDGPVYTDVAPAVQTLTISAGSGKAVSHYSVSYTPETETPETETPETETPETQSPETQTPETPETGTSTTPTEVLGEQETPDQNTNSNPDSNAEVSPGQETAGQPQADVLGAQAFNNQSANPAANPSAELPTAVNAGVSGTADAAPGTSTTTMLGLLMALLGAVGGTLAWTRRARG